MTIQLFMAVNTVYCFWYIDLVSISGYWKPLITHITDTRQGKIYRNKIHSHTITWGTFHFHSRCIISVQQHVRKQIRRKHLLHIAIAKYFLKNYLPVTENTFTKVSIIHNTRNTTTDITSARELHVRYQLLVLITCRSTTEKSRTVSTITYV